MAEKSPDKSPSAESSKSVPTEKPTNNWWDSWISTTKSKSAEVYSMMKKDLSEISSAVKNEANHVFNTTSTVIGKTLKKELEALQRVDATFIVPTYTPEFNAWKSSLDGADMLSDGACAKRLHSSPILKAQFEKLVPDAVSKEEFWERYMFRVALLQDRLAAAARRLPIEETTTDPVLAHLPLSSAPEPIQESPKRTLSPDDIESIEEEPQISSAVVWDHEDFAHDIELTEEQQILLLEEYEKEIATKKQTKQTSTKDIGNNNKTQSTNTKPANKKQQQTRDKQNNKPNEKKNTQPIDKKNKNGRSAGKKAGKSDVCGNNMVEDYFGDKDAQKDDASSISDESWEKEFEIDDTNVKA